ncbi:MAG: response regulator [Gemmatimonadota bacterium]
MDQQPGRPGDAGGDPAEPRLRHVGSPSSQGAARASGTHRDPGGSEVLLPGVSQPRRCGGHLSSSRCDPPDVAVLDSMLPDGDGVSLATDLANEVPGVGIIIATGLDLDEEDLLMCREHGVRILRKPFLAEELLTAIRSFGAKVRRAAAGR